MLFTYHESMGWRQDVKTFPGLLFVTHFIYVTSTESCNGISEFSEFLPQKKQEEL